MSAPPDAAIAAAIHAAKLSPCQKSKRGVSIFSRVGIGRDESLPFGISTGHNGPPPGIECDGSEGCRKDCALRCVHAEMRALRLIEPVLASAIRRARGTIELVHVKAVDGGVVGGGGPSCVTCSRDILDSGLVDLVWLYELRGPVDPATRLQSVWCSYDAPSFHTATLLNNGIY